MVIVCFIGVIFSFFYGVWKIDGVALQFHSFSFFQLPTCFLDRQYWAGMKEMREEIKE